MSEMFDRFSSVLTESEDGGYNHNRPLDIDRVVPQNPTTINQKIFLPRGSGQSIFEPRPYYYPASKSGVVPSWVIDENAQNRDRHLNS